MSVRIGLIGAGRVADLHAAAVTASGNQVAAFCDLNLELAQEKAAHHRGAVATDSMEEFFALADIPAIVVAVPNHLHREVALRVLTERRHLLLEKPMALSVAECDEIIAAAEQAGVHVQMGFVSRCAPAAVALHKLVQADRFGRIYHAKAMMYRRRGIPGLGGWFTTRSRAGGGALIDIGVHLVDLVLHLTGHPTVQRVSADCTSTFGSPIDQYTFTEMWAGPPKLDGVFDVDDGVTALMRCNNGMTFELNVTWAANLPAGVIRDGVVLLGDRGGCHADIWSGSINIAGEQDGLLVDVTPHLSPDSPWDQAWREQHVRFARTATSGEPPHATLAHGRAVQAIIEAMYRSSNEQCEVAVAH